MSYSDFYFKSLSPSFTGGYKKVTAFKNQGSKVMIALGGWGDSGGDKYSRLVGDASARKTFIDDVVTFIEDNNFDGLDLDWEFPGCWHVRNLKSLLSEDLIFCCCGLASFLKVSLLKLIRK